MDPSRCVDSRNLHCRLYAGSRRWVTGGGGHDRRLLISPAT